MEKTEGQICPECNTEMKVTESEKETPTVNPKVFYREWSISAQCPHCGTPGMTVNMNAYVYDEDDPPL